MNSRARARKIKRLRERDGGFCWICLGPLVGGVSDITLDHIIPLSRGGGNEDANLRLAHGRCNTHRGAPDYPVVDPREASW